MRKPGNGWRLLIAVIGAVAFLGVLAAGVVVSGRSLVIIDNRSEAALSLTVDSTTRGDFRWSGELKPRQRLFRLARFTADGGMSAVCRDAEGVYRSTGGHVAPGRPYRVDVVAASCASVRIEADTVP